MKPISIFAFGILLLCGCKQGDDQNTPSGVSENDNNENPNRLENRRVKSKPSSLETVLKFRGTGEPRTKDEADRLDESITSLSDPDLLKLLEETSKSRNSSLNKITFTYAVAELAKRDPQSVLSWFTPEEMEHGEAGWITVAAILGKSNPDILKTWLLEDLKKGSLNVQSQCIVSGLMCMSAGDPRSAFEFSAKIDRNLLPNDALINSIFFKYGNTNPAEAEAAAIKTFKGADLDQALHAIARGAGAINPTSGIEIALRIVDESCRGQAVAVNLSSWMNSDRPAALKRLQELDPKELQACLSASPGSPNSLVNKLGKDNPEILCALLNTLVASSSNQNLFQAAVDSLTVHNPGKSMELIETIPDGEMKKNMLGAQYRAMAVVNSADALAKASTITDSGLRAEAFDRIGDVVGTCGLEATLKATEELSANDKNALIAAAIPHIAYQNPKEAAEFLARGDFSLETAKKQEVLTRLGERLNGTDASYAKDWLEKLPPDDQPSAMTGIAVAMAKNDVQGLSSMLSSLPQDKKWEAGVRILIQNISGSDPQMAKKWKEALAAAGYK